MAYIRRWLLKRKERQLIRLLDTFDDRMKAAGMTRAERRQFWRDVIASRINLRVLGGGS